MNIGALSSGLSQATLQSKVGISVENLVLNTAKEQGSQLVGEISTSIPHPTLGNILDLKG